MTRYKKLTLFKCMVWDAYDDTRQYPNKDTYYATKVAATAAGIKWVAMYPTSLQFPEDPHKAWAEEHTIIIME
jgi:hypothetical protein